MRVVMMLVKIIGKYHTILYNIPLERSFHPFFFLGPVHFFGGFGFWRGRMDGGQTTCHGQLGISLAFPPRGGKFTTTRLRATSQNIL